MSLKKGKASGRTAPEKKLSTWKERLYGSATNPIAVKERARVPPPDPKNYIKPSFKRSPFDSPYHFSFVFLLIILLF